MLVTCPACGGQSRDSEFCDHCNADLAPRFGPAGVPATCPLDPERELTPEQVEALSRPATAAVLRVGADAYRVHWIGRAAWAHWRPHVEERLRCHLPVLPPGRLLEQDAGVWVVVETSLRPFAPWVDFHRQGSMAELRRFVSGLEALAQALQVLHDQGFVWLPFDPGQIEEAVQPADKPAPPAARVRFTNLDLQLQPAGQCPTQLECPPSFSAPEIARFQADHIGPRTDVYRLALYAYYGLARLLPQGVPGHGLEAFEFLFPPLRVYAPRLPPGIAPVIERGLAHDPQHRFATPGELVEALSVAVRRAEERRSATAPVRWDLGSHSRAGRTKTALGRGNEDLVLVRTFTNPARALLAVADGITTCHVGSGALASWMTTLVLENTFTPDSEVAGFPRLIRSACRHSSELLLSWAVEKGYQSQLEEGRDLMGSTLTAGWLEGNRLSLANLGDSRAYLVTADGGVEQLTVDGDLGSELLATGTPPEEVRALDSLARALRVCVGGCTRNEAGRLTILEEYCQPMLSFWSLVPGDVVVLCSDGLVEEGAFLEPYRLAEIVQQHQDLSAQELAVLLADEADAIHRLPSQLEPEGFGDNISCIVVRVHG